MSYLSFRLDPNVVDDAISTPNLDDNIDLTEDSVEGLGFLTPVSIPALISRFR